MNANFYLIDFKKLRILSQFKFKNIILSFLFISCNSLKTEITLGDKVLYTVQLQFFDTGQILEVKIYHTNVIFTNKLFNLAFNLRYDLFLQVSLPSNQLYLHT